VRQQKVRKDWTVDDRVVEILLGGILRSVNDELGRTYWVSANAVWSPDTLSGWIEFGNQETILVNDILVALDFRCQLKHRQPSFIESGDAVMFQNCIRARLWVEGFRPYLQNRAKWNFPPLIRHYAAERLEVHEPRLVNGLRHLL
jgi:hypothetical protein